jgi:hypothetical protein
LVDRVSKNGYLLLNVGPKPDGTIPEGAREVLLAMGAWLEINGEAIYETTPWMVAGEGPTNLGDASDIGFNETGIVYTEKDIRFTVKGDDLYATFLDWPGEWAVINSIRGTDPEPEGFGKERTRDISSLVGKTISEELDGELYKIVFMEDNKVLVSGGEAGDGLEGYFEQDGEEVYIEIDTEKLDAIYDGESLVFEEEDRPVYPGFYKEEIKRISLLGDGKDLKWSLTPGGLVVEMPENKPCDYAYVLKIERHHYPKLK